jgi:hypothetical protein
MKASIPRVIAVGLLAVPLVAQAGDTHESKDAVPNSGVALPSAPLAATMPKASPEVVARMQAMRDMYNARVAVYDRAEQAFRTPTAQERLALSADAQEPESPMVRELSHGGVALGAAAGELSFLMVEVQPDGTTVMHHADPAPQSQVSAEAQAQPAREVRHAE